MATITKRKDANKKKWKVDYRDQHGTRRAKHFATEREAKQFLVRAQHEVAEGIHTPDRTSVTLAKAAELWLDGCRARRLESTTIESYENLLRYIVFTAKRSPAGEFEFIGHHKLSRLTAPMLQIWGERLMLRVSPPLAAKTFLVLRMILKDAQRRGLVAQNVAVNLDFKVSARDKERLEVGIHIPDKTQMTQLQSACAGGIFDRYRVLLLTAALTGLRASELRGLPWSAVDFAARTITVRQRADEHGVIGSPKSKSARRTIPLSPYLVNALKIWRLACPISALDLVFPTTTGTVQRHAHITERFWHPLQRRAGLVDRDGKPLFDFHALRHFAASVWIASYPPKRVQTLLGHSTIQLTFDIYGHLFPNAENDAIAFESFAADIGLVA
jgi:integrase